MTQQWLPQQVKIQQIILQLKPKQVVKIWTPIKTQYRQQDYEREEKAKTYKNCLKALLVLRQPTSLAETVPSNNIIS